MTLRRPIVLYGSESWPSRKAEELRPRVLERKALRKIYGSTLDRHTIEWRENYIIINPKCVFRNLIR